MPSTALVTESVALRVEPFALDDLTRIEPQPAQREDYDLYATDPDIRMQLLAGPAWTAWRGDRPLGAAGLMPLRPGAAHAWALVDARTRGHEFVRAHFEVAAKMAWHIAQWPRVEMFADPDFAQGIRWATLLGFTLEGRYERFLPTPRVYNVYVRHA